MVRKKDEAAPQQAPVQPVVDPNFCREKKRYEFVLEAVTPIAHHAENDGNEAIAFRRTFRVKDGFVQIPIVTGDTCRHGLREAAAYAVLNAANMLTGANLSEGAIRLLMAGGMMTGRGDGGTISLDRYRELCELIPPLALFGGCCDNRCIPGRLAVEDAVLICAELDEPGRDYIPQWCFAFERQRNGAVEVSTHFIEDQQRVRMDPTLNPQVRLLMSADAQVKVLAQMQASEAAHHADDAVEREKSKSTMMPRRFEEVSAGALFSWAVEATTYTPLDVDVFNMTVTAWLREARVGGKRGVGRGRIRALDARNITITAPIEERSHLDTQALAPRIGEVFRAHVAERAPRIRDFLRGVNA